MMDVQTDAGLKAVATTEPLATIKAACEEFERIRNDLLELMAEGRWTDEQIAGGEKRIEYFDVLIDSLRSAAAVLPSSVDPYPIFDILPRLLASWYKTKEQDGEWHLFRADGEGVVSGKTFRDLCVNIVLAGL